MSNFDVKVFNPKLPIKNKENQILRLYRKINSSRRSCLPEI